ncbi:MAG: hypothetical protein CVU39_14160 [Chloroflexi bacterium HGW-Chloroflexi-10]|nr:MAG: hypothetical protein CVU39_14160 [Chloroflexi bacterium HGW-Chloroflexi-10]
MTTADEKIYNEVLTAMQEGNNKRAKDLLTRLLRQNQQNADYWLWMSAVVTSTKERRYCLNQVLQIDPKNSAARRGLILLGDLPPDPEMIVPLDLQKRSWQPPVAAGSEKEKIKIPWQMIALSLLGIVIISVAIYFFVNSDRLTLFRRPQIVLGTAQATPTFPPQPTKVETPTPVYIGPTPPWAGLQITYTPTPLYVSTPHNVIEAYSIAMRAFQRQEYTRAIEYFEQTISSEPNAPDIYFYLGEAEYMSGNFQNAITAYNQAISLDASFGPAYFGRARAKLSLNPDSYEEPINDMQNAVQLDPNMGEAYLVLASYYLDVDDLDQAAENLEIADELLPDSPLVSLGLGRLALAEEDFNKAEIYALAASQKDITSLEAYRFLGEVYLKSGKVKEALDPLYIYTAYTKTKDAQAIAWLGRAYAANDLPEKALETFTQAISLDKFQVDIYLIRGQLYLEQQENENALEDFSMAFEIQPTSYDACILLSETLLLLERPGNSYQQAGECQKLAEDDIQLARMFFNRALALEALDNKVAQQDWERMLELPPDSIDPVWKATAEAYLEKYYTATPAPSSTITITPTLRQTQGKTTTLTPTSKPTLRNTTTRMPTRTPSPTPRS